MKAEQIAYGSRISPRCIFVYARQALSVFDWLIDNGHTVESWELFLQSKKENTRTLKYGTGVIAPVRGIGSSDAEIGQEIGESIESWSEDPASLPLVVCLNLSDDLIEPDRNLPLVSRVSAGFLGLLFCFVAISLVLLLLKVDAVRNDSVAIWLAPIAMSGFGFVFLRAAVSGKARVPLMESDFVMKLVQSRARLRTKDETGSARWPIGNS